MVATVTQRSYEVQWDRLITLLLVDGLHDYASVSRDFWHFAPWLADGAHVVFHDYAHYYPGVPAFVDELIAAGRYAPLYLADSLMVGNYRGQA